MLAFPVLGFADYKVYSAPQNTSAKSVVVLPEPTVLCTDTQNLNSESEVDTSTYWLKRTYWTPYGTSLYVTLKYKGTTFLNNQSFSPSRSNINGREISYDGKDWILRNTGTILSTNTSGDGWSESKAYYSFCFDPA